MAWALVALCFVTPISIASLNITAAALTILLLAADAAGEEVPWLRAVNPLGRALAAYFVVALVVCATSVDRAVSYTQLIKDFHKVWFLWVAVASAGLARERRAPLAFGTGLCVMAVVGIFQALLQRDGERLMRAHAFIHPASFGELLAIGLLGGVCLLLRPEEAAADDVTPPRLYGFLALTGLAFVLNQTRAAFLGVALGLAVLGALERRVRRWWAPAMLVGVVIVACWELLPGGRSLIATARVHGLDPMSNQQLTRLALWDVAWRMFKDHPWTGVGIGNFKTLFPTYFAGTLERQRVWGSAHNLYLHQLAERGLIGLAAVLGVFAAMISRAFQRARLDPTALNLWAFSASCAFAIMNLTEVSFQTEQVASAMILVWALAEVL